VLVISELDQRLTLFDQPGDGGWTTPTKDEKKGASDMLDMMQYNTAQLLVIPVQGELLHLLSIGDGGGRGKEATTACTYCNACTIHRTMRLQCFFF
jgi:hypothetical protein